jgi:histidinol-phosphate/aromatic aminotransferase/cobyric acid decarboxylase-like protein
MAGLQDCLRVTVGTPKEISALIEAMSIIAAEPPSQRG